jgi:aminoglycoside 3-N-acetyltransferase I
MVIPVGYAYRRLTRADVSLLKDLLRVFGQAFGEVDTYQHSVPDDDYLTRLLGKQHFIAVVAMTGEEVVGGLTAYELDKFEQDRREIYIYDLAVAETHRRQGVATGMIGELGRIASERNVFVIFVQADLADDAAIALYESVGRRKTAYHFDIAVPAPVRQRGDPGRKR